MNPSKILTGGDLESQLTFVNSFVTKKERKKAQPAPRTYSALRGKPTKTVKGRIAGRCDTDTAKQFCTRGACKFEHPFRTSIVKANATPKAAVAEKED